MKHLPIGVFDSGLGGLTVLRALQRQLPAESFIYIADNKYIPYGARSPLEIQTRSHNIASFLAAIPVKAIVVACNTATAVSIHELRKHFHIPIVGVEPGIKPACEITHSGHVGVMATQGTLSSQKYENLKNLHGKDVVVHEEACIGLVSAIEQEYPDFDEALQIIKRIVINFKDKNVDAIVLGCTHYPLLEKIIQKECKQAVTINTHTAIARHLKRRLNERSLLELINLNPTIHYLASRATNELTEKITRIMHAQHKVTLMQLPDWCI